MTTENLALLISLLTTLFGTVASFILQKDTRKIKNLERKNEMLKNNLIKSLNAIKSYQKIEEINALNENTEISIYRRKIRKEFDVEFNKEFLTPGNINNLLENINSR